MEEQKLRCFIQVERDGNIGAMWRFRDDTEPPKGAVEVTTEPEKRLLNSEFDGRNLIYTHGKVRRKPVVTLVTDKDTITANGEDIATITMQGVPENYEQVTVSINQEEFQVAPDEHIEVSSDTAQTIYVRVNEPLLQGEMVSVRAKEEEDEA